MKNPSQEKFKTYLFSYTHDNAEWGFEIQAENEDDAKLRVSKLMYAKYDGELAMKIPSQLGIFPRLIIMLLNSPSALMRLLSAR
ncbi:MAG: hypothetical protein IMF15_03370 [Proteobacteria bacterium]|nr:hypothetical protein [Pseudomonadota bacterium]